MKIRAHLKHHPLDDKRVALPGAKIRAHLKHHPLDDKRVALPGASIFAHLRVVGFGTGRSIRVYDFQV